jgi:hypothetical protein
MIITLLREAMVRVVVKWGSKAKGLPLGKPFSLKN